MRSIPEVTTTSPTTTSASPGTYFITRSLAPASAKPSCPETTPATRLRSIITPAPLSRSRRSCTLAALGPTATTRPSTPVGLITAASRATPASRPRSRVRVRNQGMPSRVTTSAAIVSRGRVCRKAEDLAQPLRLPGLVLPLLEQGLQVADLLLEALVRLVHAAQVDPAAPAREDAPRARPRTQSPRGESRSKTAALQEGDPAPRVDLMADHDQVEDHQAHQEESALVDDGEPAPSLADRVSPLVSQG